MYKQKINVLGKFIVSARKYRPTQFDEILGQQHITSTLKNALKNDHLAHAFLFCGPRGVGKTSCARILAKVINCDSPTDNFESCGKCSSCESFDRNASFNIFEMDGASNNKVEHIHHLLDQVRVAPPPGKYKVFIIDEVHMLTASAFNAFLKTLEEPPEYAIFILATTEKHKILPTILSRCQIYDFNRIQIGEMVTQLRTICTEESIEADDNALQLIASKADGAMRDALSIFDRMASFREGNIRYEDILQNLNILDFDYFFKFVESFLSEDLPGVMLLLDEILQKGFEGSALILGLSEHLRQLLVCQDAKTESLILGSDELKGRYMNQAKYTSVSFLLSALSILNDSDVNYAMAKNKRLHVEISLSKISFLHRRLQTNLLDLAEEKKTKIVNDLKVDSSTEDSSSKKIDISDSKIKKDVDITDSQSISVEEEQSEDTKTNTNSTIQDETPEPKTNGVFGIPGLSVPSIGSLESIESELALKEAELQKRLKKFNLEDTKKLWLEYAEDCGSPSVKQILKSAILSIKDETLQVEVSSLMGKNAILQEAPIMDGIRELFQNPEIILEINIDPKRAAENVIPKSKRLFSDKEKYELLLEKNTSLSKLQQKFGLKFDES